jgi:hypothetical protein
VHIRGHAHAGSGLVRSGQVARITNAATAPTNGLNIVAGDYTYNLANRLKEVKQGAAAIASASPSHSVTRAVFFGFLSRAL